MAAFGQASFDGHFKDQVSQQNITVDLTFEVPFDCMLTRASVFTNTGIAVDAYVTMFKNDGSQLSDHIVDPSQLPVFTNQLNGINLPNIPAYKGETITVRLNIFSLNTVQRCKWAIGCASRVFTQAA